VLVRPLLDVLAPPACVSCRRRPSPGDVLCRDCRIALRWLGPDTCARCGLPAPCGRSCPARGMAFERAWAPVAYGGPAAALVVALKERGARAAAAVMAGQMAAVAPEGLLEDGVLVPVPGDPLRRRRRGIDHAAVLARRLGARAGLHTAPVLQRRASRSGRQAGAGRARRLTPDRIGIELRGEAPEVAVLVDDVHTTGATLDACARALRSAGTRKVAAVCYARTLPTTGVGRTFGDT
jgi:predicted amidophosphoribosyltransferase